MDLLVTSAIVLSFATFVTAHIALAVGIGTRGPWWRGPTALVVVPLAPYWGFRAHMRTRAVLWTTALVIYAGALILSHALG
jgi:hypothetical protein